ncbi:nucleotide exchange factor GrpE [Streptosporangium sp. NPDC023615]|uniref:nucleotide exchange factor GrpE n=1 Tax=Streptosporangium sp. NPDC023615 TaxID=3154794 RepID=UPI00343A3299
MNGEGPAHAGVGGDDAGGPWADPAPPVAPGSTDRGPADPGAAGPEATGPGAGGTNAGGPGAGNAGTAEPGAAGPGTVNPGTVNPGTADPGTAVPGAAERLAAIESAVAEFNRRSAHRETVIDRLHEENQALRGGLYRTILEPVVADLIRMHDALLREVTRLTGDGGEKSAKDGEGEAADTASAANAANAAHGRLLASFADDTLLMLERCGLEEFTARPGEPFDAGRHTAVSVVPVTDEALDNTVAEVVAIGFVERETGRVRRPVRARFHRYRRADDRDHGGDHDRDRGRTGVPDGRDPADMT